MSLMHTHPRVWARIRLTVLVRDQYQCQIRAQGCTHRATQVDHIISLMDGGTDDLSNLQAACAPCNKRKGAGSFLNGDRSPDASHQEIPPFAPITGRYDTKRH
jgi:5-methylcytosine-specific restriction endonuclease McrA